MGGARPVAHLQLLEPWYATSGTIYWIIIDLYANNTKLSCSVQCTMILYDIPLIQNFPMIHLPIFFNFLNNLNFKFKFCINHGRALGLNQMTLTKVKSSS
jgi:hypothetical protein